MKTIKQIAAQGDVLFRRVPSVPPNATAEKRDGRLILAHSETGHHHAIDDDGVVRYEVGDPLVCYLAMTGPHADVVHHRTWDTHETIRLLGGSPETPAIWEVRRQREHTPEGWRRVED